MMLVCMGMRKRRMQHVLLYDTPMDEVEIGEITGDTKIY
jgi:hypothetical protein